MKRPHRCRVCWNRIGRDQPFMRYGLWGAPRHHTTLVGCQVATRRVYRARMNKGHVKPKEMLR